MILTLLLNLFYSLLSFLLNLLPVGALPTAVNTAVLYFWSAVNSFSYIIPVGTLISALGLILVFDAGMLLWHFINWIIKKIPQMN